jgi:outer membrane lipoprotein-sorting protein
MNSSGFDRRNWFDAASTVGRRDHAALIRMYEVFDQDHDRLREELMASIAVTTPRSAPQSRLAWTTLGGFLMNYVLTRKGSLLLAPAACILAVTVALYTWSEGPAFAQIVDHLRSVETIACRVRTSVAGSASSQSEGKLYFSARHGVRYDVQTEGATGFVFYRPTNAPATAFNPETKTRFTVSNSDGGPFGAGRSAPDEWIRRLLAIADEPDRLLGRQKIDGTIAAGFEIAGDKLGSGAVTDTETSRPTSVQVWVDAVTWMPVRYVVQASRPEIDAEITIVHDQFQWNEAHDATFFEPPADVDHVDVNLRIPRSDEDALIGGLRLYADTMDEYPSVLDSAILTAQVVASLAVKGGVARAPQDPAFQRIAQEVLVIHAGCEFYRKLERESREPEYFGIDVKPGDADAVLLRWRLDNGRSRIVYGDLRVQSQK